MLEVSGPAAVRRDDRPAAGERTALVTLRKIERGAIAAPAFFTVAALARALDLDLDLTDLARRLTPEDGSRKAG